MGEQRSLGEVIDGYLNREGLLVVDLMREARIGTNIYSVVRDESNYSGQVLKKLSEHIGEPLDEMVRASAETYKRMKWEEIKLAERRAKR